MITNHAAATKSLSSQLLSTKSLVLAGMFAAVLAIISQLSIPMPTGMPITIQVFGVALVGSVLGWRLGVFSTVVYILIGLAGLPVFAGFHGGIASLVSITGGYIWTWPVMVFLCGLSFHTKNHKLNLLLTILSALVGLLINETCGAIQWSVVSGGAMSLKAVFAYSIVAFIPKDIIITILAVIIGKQIRKPLYKAGYLS